MYFNIVVDGWLKLVTMCARTTCQGQNQTWMLGSILMSVLWVKRIIKIVWMVKSHFDEFTPRFWLFASWSLQSHPFCTYFILGQYGSVEFRHGSKPVQYHIVGGIVWCSPLYQGFDSYEFLPRTCLVVKTMFSLLKSAVSGCWYHLFPQVLHQSACCLSHPWNHKCHAEVTSWQMIFSKSDSLTVWNNPIFGCQMYHDVLCITSIIKDRTPRFTLG